MPQKPQSCWNVSWPVGLAVLSRDGAQSPPQFLATNNFSAKITRISDFFAFANFRKTCKFSDSIKRPKTTSNLSKAHETRDSLAVTVRRLSWSISIHFVAIHLEICHHLQKYTLKPPHFGVIDVDNTTKLVTIACYDKQHVCAYLQLFSRYTS